MEFVYLIIFLFFIFNYHIILFFIIMTNNLFVSIHSNILYFYIFLQHLLTIFPMLFEVIDIIYSEILFAQINLYIFLIIIDFYLIIFFEKPIFDIALIKNLQSFYLIAHQLVYLLLIIFNEFLFTLLYEFINDKVILITFIIFAIFELIFILSLQMLIL